MCIESRQKANGLINSKYKQDEVDKLLTLMPFDIITKTPMTYTERFKLAGLKPFIINRVQAEEIKTRYTCYFQGVGEIPCDGLVGYSDVYPTREAQILKLYGIDFADTIITQVQPILSYDSLTFSLTYWFDPVELGGSTIKKVGNAGSYKTCKERKLGVGSKVQVRLAKQVIPQIKSSEGWDDSIDQTIHCPYCREPLEEFEGKLICPNKDCGSIIDYFAHKYISYYKIKTEKKNYIISSIEEFNKYCSHFKLKVSNSYDFKWYCVKPPRVRESLTDITDNDTILDYIRQLSNSQKRYYNMIVRNLKVLYAKL